MNFIRRFGRIILVVLLVAMGFVMSRLYRLGAESREIEPRVGLAGGSLLPCPPAPGCVSSAGDETDARRIEPVLIEGSEMETFNAIRSYLHSHPRVEVLVDTGEYIHAEFSSRVFGIVDDFEVHFRPRDQRIDLRSASRVGPAELDVHQERVRQLRGWLTRRSN